MDILKTMEEKAFWGYEFLTWLWFLSETSGGEVPVEGHPGVNLWIEEHLALLGPDSGSKENIIKSGDVASSAEAAAALSVGKKVKLARFGMSQGELSWTFVLDGATLDIRGMKIPHVEAEAEDADAPEALVYLRMGMVRRAVDVIESLFATFARLKASAAWEAVTVPEISTWIREKSGK